MSKSAGVCAIILWTAFIAINTYNAGYLSAETRQTAAPKTVQLAREPVTACVPTVCAPANACVTRSHRSDISNAPQ